MAIAILILAVIFGGLMLYFGLALQVSNFCTFVLALVLVFWCFIASIDMLFRCLGVIK